MQGQNNTKKRKNSINAIYFVISLLYLTVGKIIVALSVTRIKSYCHALST